MFKNAILTVPKHTNHPHSSSFVLIAVQLCASAQQVADFCRRGSQRQPVWLLSWCGWWFLVLLLRKCGKGRPLGEFKRVAPALNGGWNENMCAESPFAPVYSGVHHARFFLLLGGTSFGALRLFLFIKFATLWRKAHSCETMAKCEGP